MEAGAEQGSCGRRQEEGVENMRGQHFILNSDQSPCCCFSLLLPLPKPPEREKALHKIHLSTHFLCSLALLPPPCCAGNDTKEAYSQKIDA